jgi:hypothetical protein
MVMIRHLLVGAAALTLMTGGASAQDSTYYSNTRTVTQTNPFGSSRTVTTTTSQALPLPSGDDGTDYDSANAVADLPPPPEAPPPNYAPPPDYARTTTTTEYGPNGVETQRTDRYQRQQGLYDPNGELSTHTTTTRTNSVTYGPPPVYTPNAAAVGPSPSIEMPPPYGQTTVITHSTTDE